MPIRIFLCLVAAILSIIVIIIQRAQDQSGQILVQTSSGQMKGSLMKTLQGKDIYAFRGLRYAEPPTGKLRFKNPVPVRAWKGVFDASREGPSCVQFINENMSEDCLTLNIYTNQISNGKKLPVIVYIHPGAYITGSSQSFVSGPLYLLGHDIVLVTINHRLGSLGFINTGDDYSTGNYGFKDQVVALQFIRDNIAVFGGDPDSVTLTGQSTGSRSIILHMLSPLSKGLFHKAIAMSGTSILPIPPQKQQTDLAFKQARLLNCTTETREGMFKCLRNKSVKELGMTANSFKTWYIDPLLVWYPSIEPNVEGSFLNEDPEKLVRNGKINSVPLIIGYTKDEASSRSLQGIEEALNGKNKYFDGLNENWDELAPTCFGYKRNKHVSKKIRQYYFGNKNITLNNSDTLKKLYAHALIQYPLYRTASLVSNFSSSPVYFYEFSYQGRYSIYNWNGTRNPAAGVAHGDDLQYIFHIPNDVYHKTSFPIYTENDPEFIMVQRLSKIWAHFAKTSEPLPKDHELFKNVTWPRFAPGNEYYMDIGKEMILEKGLLPKIKGFWNDLFSQHFQN